PGTQAGPRGGRSTGLVLAQLPRGFGAGSLGRVDAPLYEHATVGTREHGRTLHARSGREDSRRRHRATLPCLALPSLRRRRRRDGSKHGGARPAGREVRALALPPSAWAVSPSTRRHCPRSPADGPVGRAGWAIIAWSME